ncbi:uridine phosphorylase [Candidatus Bathyarchaeota archaeon]|nr:MAG: uridine phosphorylase [Candidatus Bathyarchaeota archaeon]
MNSIILMECLTMKGSIPLFKHDLNAPTAFSPKSVVEAVRLERNLEAEPIPSVCVLEFDGDLTDWLVSTGKAKPWKSWACFHTTMFTLEVNGVTCGIVPRTIGGAYAVLVAEQMAVSGARVILGLTSAGRVSSRMPLPGLVVATSAIRDEGTSYHYLPPTATVNAPSKVTHFLEAELHNQPLPVLSGTVWTTDAPYRETASQLIDYANAGVLAVEMQAASLFAFSQARQFPVGLVAYVTNGVDQMGEPFDKGSRLLEFDVLKAVCIAGKRFLQSLDI